MHPWPACIKKSTRRLPQVQPGQSGLPCATVLTLMACSPREPGLIAPVITRLVTARLDLSVGRPGPHAFPSASAPFVRTKKPRASPTRPSHPASRFLTIAIRPSCRGGTPRRMHLIWGRRQVDLRKTEYADCDRLARRAVRAWRAKRLCRQDRPGRTRYRVARL